MYSSRTARARARFSPASMTRPERIRLGGMFGFILLLHVVGWSMLIVLVAPRHVGADTKALGVGIGVTAYTLGMRHAFDADHIAAIDNTTRKLVHQGRRPLSVGFWFSLGHSSVVFALAFLLSLGAKALIGPVRDDGSQLHRMTSLIGTGVSGAFLYLIAVVNIGVFAGIWKVFKRMRRGHIDEAELQEQLERRGLMNRVLSKATRSVDSPGRMYPVGVLFGLGFDTATEVALLVLAGTGSASGLPWYAILCLPILFAAGMSLFDTIDGSFMNFAYGWALSQPVRKVYYNLTITGLSVAVALLVGTVELAGLAADQLSVRGGPLRWAAGIDLNSLGFLIVGLFAATYGVATAVWKLGRLEDRWKPPLRPPRLSADTAGPPTLEGLIAKVNGRNGPGPRNAEVARPPAGRRSPSGGQESPAPP
jgi:nickel/cobalt transporter (NiCoT) family protein